MARADLELYAYATANGTEAICYDVETVWVKFPGFSTPFRIRVTNQLPGVRVEQVTPGGFYATVTYDSNKALIPKDPETIHEGLSAVLCIRTVPTPADATASYGMLTDRKSVPGDIVIGATTIGSSGLTSTGIAAGPNGVVIEDNKSPATVLNKGGVVSENWMASIPGLPPSAFIILPRFLPSLTIFTQVAGVASNMKDLIKIMKES
jgi:hypothetical protein